LPVPKEYVLKTVDKMWGTHWARLDEGEQEIVDDKIMNVLKINPYDSEALSGELKGMRSYNQLRSDLRIYFAICHECRKGGFTKVNNCTDCNETGNDTVKLFAAGPHSIYNTLGRERRKRLSKRDR
jgi:hypothetical protein